MLKKFHDWHLIKHELHHKEGPSVFFKEREIWWCCVGYNIGWEINGKNADFSRPILVVRKFGLDSFLGLPLTSTTKEDYFHYKLEAVVTGKEGSVVLSQIRHLDAKRLVRKMGVMPKEVFKSVKLKVKSML